MRPAKAALQRRFAGKIACAKTHFASRFTAIRAFNPSFALSEGGQSSVPTILWHGKRG
jgi:hypothetical protein